MHGVARLAGLVLAAALLLAPAARAATPEASTTDRLQDRREVASGDRAYVEGFQDGRFYANGWHTAGEMGGVWAPPLKLVDGVWFGLDDQWVGPATKFTSGWGYTRYDLPDTDGLQVARTDFVPDGRRAALFGLKLTNPGAADRTVTVKVDAHSELMSAYPWGGTTPSASDNIADHGSYADKALQFTDDGAPPGAAEHHYAALVAANQDPASGTAADTGGAFRGTQGDSLVLGQRRHVGAERLRRRAVRQRHRRRTAVRGHRAGGREPDAVGRGRRVGPGRRRRALRARRRRCRTPRASSARSWPRASTWREWSQVSLPGDPLLQQAIDWGKQNLADLTQTASDLQIRWTNQGKQFPAPLGTVAHARWFGAGFPDYPWIFATDGEYTAFAALALGPVRDRRGPPARAARHLRRAQRPVGHRRARDGLRRLRLLRPRLADHKADGDDERLQYRRDDQVPEHRRAHLALDRRRRLPRRDVRLRQAQPAGGRPAPGRRPRRLARGVGQRRAPGHGAGEARQRRLLHPRAGRPGRHGAVSARRPTFTWAKNLARKLEGQFEGTWWDASASQYADSLLDPGNQQVFQKHWIGQVPMEDELTGDGDQAQPGLASYDHGTAALTARETACFSGDRPGSRGLFHTGCGGGEGNQGDFEIFSLTTAIQAVGEGNYGRLGADQQQRYTDANAETMFSEPATGGTPDEQPGAMPEIFPSTPNGDPSQGILPNLERCWTCRSMVMQASGNYGTAWPVIHQQLGVRPYLNDGEVQVVPQVPPGQPSVAGTNIRLGDGAVDVSRRARAIPTPPRWTRRTRPEACSSSGTHCRAGRGRAPSRSTATRSSTTPRRRPTAGSRSAQRRARAARTR